MCESDVVAHCFNPGLLFANVYWQDLVLVGRVLILLFTVWELPNCNSPPLPFWLEHGKVLQPKSRNAACAHAWNHFPMFIQSYSNGPEGTERGRILSDSFTSFLCEGTLERMPVKQSIIYHWASSKMKCVSMYRRSWYLDRLGCCSWSISTKWCIPVNDG